MSKCNAKIRPFPNSTELECTLPDDGHEKHTADLFDYAWVGSHSVINWYEDDRNTFRGEWSPCTAKPGCILPGGHPRECAL